MQKPRKSSTSVQRRKFYPLNKNGIFSVKLDKNKKGQQAVAIYNKDGSLAGLKALNYQKNKTYNEKFAAEVLGLQKCDEGYFRKQVLSLFQWQRLATETIQLLY